MKVSQVIINLCIVSMIPSAMGRRLGGKNKEEDSQTANRRLAESRFLKAPPGAETLPEEYTIQFVEGKEDKGKAFVDELIQKYETSEKLFEYNSALQAVTIVGVPEDDMMEFLVDHLDTISTVEEDTMIHADSVASWGLDRIDQESLPLNNNYNPPNSLNGNGVDIYILDSGVDTTHSEFRGRILTGADFTGENRHGQDPHGHGTHVAGTAAGSTYGVAKGARIIPVRVLGSNGRGWKSWSTAGIDWAVGQAASTGRRSVINMSLGGDISTSQNTAIRNAVNAGVVVVVSAGNDNTDACTQGPANSQEAITVAATSSNDARWYWNSAQASNWGSCVDIFAPGSSIRSARTGGGSTYKTGTSMASPHVAGAAALLLQADRDASARGITSKLVQDASNGKVSNTQGSPNKLLYLSSGSSTPPPPTGNYQMYKNSLPGNLCMDLKWGQTHNGNYVQLYSCNGSSAQQWSFDSEGRIRSKLNPSKCVEAGRAGGLYDKLFLWDCHNGLHQKWTRYTSGLIRNKSSQRYIGVAWCANESGRQLELRNYEGGTCGTAQRWTVSDGSSCQDSHGSCAYWAGIGECSKNPGWMLPNCQKSCQQC